MFNIIGLSIGCSQTTLKPPYASIGVHINSSNRIQKRDDIGLMDGSLICIDLKSYSLVKVKTLIPLQKYLLCTKLKYSELSLIYIYVLNKYNE